MKRKEEYILTSNFNLSLPNFVHIKDIVIPEEFSKTRVGHHKIIWAKEYIQRNGYFDKPISVIAEINERGKPNTLVLIDEYSRYKAAIELGLTEVPVKYISIEEYLNK